MATNVSQKRSKLMQKGEQLKASLKEDIHVVKEHSKEIGRHGLIIGGVLVVGVVLYKLMSSSGDDEQEHRHQYPEDAKVMVVQTEATPSIARSIMSSIAIFLLNIAKEKLLEYLENKDSGEEGDK